MPVTKENPANVPGAPVEERKRIPMTLPMQKLEVSEIPGYVLYWMRGTPDRIAQAFRAGYEFVDEDEVHLNDKSPGGDAAKTGNTDLGTRVSVVAGGDIGLDGQPIKLILMKIKKEWWDEGQKVLADRNEGVAAAIRGGAVGIGSEHESPMDADLRYLDKKRTTPNLFTPKRRT